MEWEDLFLLLKSSNDAGTTVSKLCVLWFLVFTVETESVTRRSQWLKNKKSNFPDMTSLRIANSQDALEIRVNPL